MLRSTSRPRKTTTACLVALLLVWLEAISSALRLGCSSGRRYAWNLGVELEISDLTDVINLVVPLFSDCSCALPFCDPGDGGVGECDCDQTVGSILTLARSSTTSFRCFRSSRQAAREPSLDAAQQSVWYDYITPEYADPAAASFSHSSTMAPVVTAS